MPAILEVTDLYRWAMQCAGDAENLGTSENKRKHLLRMHAALLVLANSPNWFCGISGRKSRQQNEAALQGLRKMLG